MSNRDPEHLEMQDWMRDWTEGTLPFAHRLELDSLRVENARLRATVEQQAARIERMEAAMKTAAERYRDLASATDLGLLGLIPADAFRSFAADLDAAREGR